MEEIKNNNDQRINVRIENYTGENPIEIIYREDKPAEHLKPIPAKLPAPINIEGTIGCVAEWLEKRQERVCIDNCRLVVDREKACIKLIVNETDTRVSLVEGDMDGMDAAVLSTFIPQSTISGCIQFTDAYSKLHINDEVFWYPAKLAKYFRINRSIFADKDEGMALVTALKCVKAKISGDYEKNKELHGMISKTEYFSQEVSHNLPDTFKVELAIFKGSPKEKYEIEIDADFIDGEIVVQLLSPAVNDEVENARDQLINNELDKIKELCPDLVIIEV